MGSRLQRGGVEAGGRRQEYQGGSNRIKEKWSDFRHVLKDYLMDWMLRVLKIESEIIPRLLALTNGSAMALN